MSYKSRSTKRPSNSCSWTSGSDASLTLYRFRPACIIVSLILPLEDVQMDIVSLALYKPVSHFLCLQDRIRIQQCVQGWSHKRKRQQYLTCFLLSRASYLESHSLSLHQNPRRHDAPHSHYGKSNRRKPYAGLGIYLPNLWLSAPSPPVRSATKPK